MSLLLFKNERTSDRFLPDIDLDDDESLGAIRCPRCSWRPSPSSRWCCNCHGTPEPPFAACGTVWNTFSTGGRCPGCSHRWRWTSCLRCDGWSPHDEWYERPSGT